MIQNYNSTELSVFLEDERQSRLLVHHIIAILSSLQQHVETNNVLYSELQLQGVPAEHSLH